MFVAQTKHGYSGDRRSHHSSNLLGLRSVFHLCSIRGYFLPGWVIAGSIALTCAGHAQTRSTDNTNAREIARLVGQLGSEDFDIRERAGQKLLEFGADAYDAVNEAARSAADAEVRYRARELLTSLARRKFAAVRRFDDHRDIVWTVAFSPDCRFVATGGGGDETDGNWTAGSDFDVRVWNAATGELVKKLAGHTSSINCLVWSADGKLLATASSDSSAILWDVTSGKPRHTFKGHTAAVSSVCLSADGKRLVTGGWDASVIVWNAETGQEEKRLAGHYGRVWDVALSPDGKTAAVCGDHPFIRLWDLDKAAIRAELQGHEQAAVRVAFSPDGTRLLSGGWDNTARIWTIKDAKYALAKTFAGHTGRVEGLAWCADGRRFVTGSLDHTVKLWDVETGAAVQSYEEHTKAIARVAASADGRHVASASWDHTTRLWPMPKP